MWHRRAYGSGELRTMTPTEIGHAAAYEAYRTWQHNSSIYEPLSGDHDRQREGLVGLAIAEATRLMGHAGRSMDRYNRVEATEAAATTATIVFNQAAERDELEGRGRHGRRRSRHDSVTGYGGSSSSYGAMVPFGSSGGAYTSDPYSYDDHSSHSSHRRPRNRRHSSASIQQPPMVIGTPITAGGYAPPGYPPSGGFGQYAGSAPVSIPGGSAYGGSAYGGGGGFVSGSPNYSYGGASGASPMFSGNGIPSSYPYQQQQAIMAPPYAPAPQIIIASPRSHKKHSKRSSSSSRHGHRSRSVEPMIIPSYAGSYRY